MRCIASKMMVACASLAWFALAITGQAFAQDMAKRTHVAQAPRVHVYLLRGIVNVFSVGLDDLHGKLVQRGYSAEINNHLAWSSLAQEAIQRHRVSDTKIIVIGHSLGADAAISFAARLNEAKVPVPLVVTFDPIHPDPIPPNVAKLLNLFQSDNGFGTAVSKGPGFHGSLSNVDLRHHDDLGHVAITKSARLHQQVIGLVTAIARSSVRHAAASSIDPKTAPTLAGAIARP